MPSPASSCSDSDEKKVPVLLTSTKFSPTVKASYFSSHFKYTDLDNMTSAVETSTYSLLPGGEQTSPEDAARGDARLYATRRAAKSSTFQYHPTVLLRLIAACLLFASFIMTAASYPEPTSLVFQIITFLRQVQVLFSHFLSHRIRLRSPIQIIYNNIRLPSSPPLRPTGLERHSYPAFHIFLDIVLILGLIITLAIQIAQNNAPWHWPRYQSETKVKAAAVGLSSCLPLILSIADAGAPRSLLVTLGMGTKAQVYKFFCELDVGLKDQDGETTGLLDDIAAEEEASRPQAVAPSHVGGKQVESS